MTKEFLAGGKTVGKNKLSLGLILLIWLFVVVLNCTVTYAADQTVVALVYHNVGQQAGYWTVTPKHLADQFAYLKKYGYQPITVQQYREACHGREILPDKAVLLTFDDGYESFYQDVFPLLKQYHYPALLSVVTSWDARHKPQDIGQIMTWDEIREVEQSGLVTIAAHSDNLHRYIVANEYNDQRAAMSTRLYVPGKGYESLAAYRKRIDEDMQKTQEVFRQKLGHKVSVYVWPYGEYTQVALNSAQKYDFDTFFTLLSGINDVNANALLRIKRAIVDGRQPENFANLLKNGDLQKQPLYVAQVDLDYIYDGNPKQMKANLDTAIQYLHRCRANTVFLEAHADDTGSGNIEQVYFYNQTAPVKADVFGHVVECFHQAGFKVYAWLSTLAGTWALADHPEDAVMAFHPKELGWYKRGSPFSSRIREKMKELVGDLAAYNDIDGIVFNDDLYLNDFEDCSPAAKRAFYKRFDRALTPDVLRDHALRQKWTKMKTEQLNAYTMELAAEMKKYRPNMAIARNIYAPLILQKESEEWFGENYPDYLKLYDYTVIMAYTRMEKAQHPDEWLKNLAITALSYPGAANKVIFKLQAYDWRHSAWIDPEELKQQVLVLKENHAINIAFYPLNVVDDFAKPVSF
jgi:biofilm PGA synthesis lipoprotein PgaB